MRSKSVRSVYPHMTWRQSQCANVKEASFFNFIYLGQIRPVVLYDRTELEQNLMCHVITVNPGCSLHHWFSSLQSPSSFSESGETGLETVKMS